MSIDATKIRLKHIKEHFEAHLLDGDDVQDCGKGMLLSRDVLEYIQEVFLPYVQVGINGQTLYQQLEDKGFKLLSAPTKE